ncbi:TlpA family protein disulfide reductase [Aliarcobacter vitoriensis]|uniref:Thioredoxin n=1 Tax=Aliarcobacter vitoriensis TaxID=2011099 RepID=A0A366MSC9_9BACT|nr:TlpA disulfide reductase family protein [Aliarcobacter vitoriensis]RBQ29186.1 thioredoxin [Aliarcobacter vitoriensis]
MKNVLVSLFAVLAFLFIGCDGGSTIDSKSLAKKKIEEDNKEFISQSFLLLTTDEKIIGFKSTANGLDFDEFKGKKAVIIDVFATWCPPCIEAIPKLREIKEKYKDDLEIVSVLFQDEKTVEEIQEFIKEYQINYPITMGEENDKLAQELNVRKIPEMFLFSKDGKFVHKFIGNAPKEELEKYIKIAIEN